MKKPNTFFLLLAGLSLLFSNCYQGSKILGRKVTRPLNIILLIGDGMGLAQISAAIIANGGLNLELFEYIGLMKTSSSDDYITDSAAGATAFSTGKKTYNGAIGLGPDSLPLPTILELAEQNGLSTGLVSTCSVTHATPASFYAHRKNREMHSEIATDFYGQGIDFVAGTGKPYFDMRRLDQSGYQVYTGSEPIQTKAGAKYFWFFNDSLEAPVARERNDWLRQVSGIGLNHLSVNKKGFFMMIEGSQIDWGGHENDFNYVMNEMSDFDRTVKLALDFAKKDGNTLVIVTADHETGGLSLVGGNIREKKIMANFANKHHTGIMVPVYAFGPGANLFTGTLENTDIFERMKLLFGF